MEMIIIALSGDMSPLKARTANTAMTTNVTMVLTFNKFAKFFKNCILTRPFRFFLGDMLQGVQVFPYGLSIPLV